MIKKVLNYVAKPIKINQKNQALSGKQQLLMIRQGYEIFTLSPYGIKLKFTFARKITTITKPLQPTAQKVQPVENTTSSSPSGPKTYIPKQTQNYTFVQLDKDLQAYQSYLNIFNTHSKKAHQKLLKNQIKIIECIIQQKREDLLNKFLSTNYKNRLANPETLAKIVTFYKKKLNEKFQAIIGSKEQCQAMLQTIALLTEYHEIELFDQFQSLFNKQLQLETGKDSLLKILPQLPSQQCQFLYIYNWLIKHKQLPQSIMQSQYLGLNTEGLKFHSLGQTFYEIRKFMRRYFAIYSKKLEKEQITQEEGSKLKTFERQFQKTSQASLIQNDVLCFLKTLKYENVRKEIEIDGFIVDFIVEGVKLKSSPQLSISTILQVMGSYHYTATGKLKAKDLRKFILLGSRYRQKKYNIKLVHYDDYNKSKGHRNKMELIRNLLEFTGIKLNWQPQNRGYDSGWQLKEVYEEFK